MAYTTQQAIETLSGYLNIRDDQKSVIADTKNRGYVVDLNSGEQVVIFIYPLVHKQDNTKNYFDTRDSGAYERGVAWRYAIENGLKYFCFGVNDQVDKYNEYIFSLECNETIIEKISGTKNGARNGPGNQIIIPNDYIPSKEYERIKNRLGIYISVIRKNCLYEYLEMYDNRPYLPEDYVEDTVSDESENQESEEAYMPLVFNTELETKYERNRIVFGAPGTGKSYELKEDCEDLLKNTNGSYERVTFHPDYSYSQFVGTYKPVMGTDEKIRYDFVPGPFMRVYVEALKSGRTENPQPHLLLIEEINRAKVAAVFGDVFQLLDRDDDGVSEYEIQASEDIRKYLAKQLGGTPDNYQKIRIPNNMFIWSTMNSADQGVFPMDTAFKRRWNFEYLGINKNEEKISGIGKIELLLDSPAYLYSSSFLLSFGAVVGLGAVSPHLIRITGAKGKAGKALISSLSVQAATLPVMLVFFGEVSVIGILLNLFVLPTVGGVLISGLCCSVLGLFSVNAGRAAAVPGRILLWLYEKVGMFAGKLPFCTWIGGLPEIWQSISYYLLLASGIILAYVMASGIQKKEENQLAVGKKVSENSDKIRGVFRKTAKRAYPAGIFLLAAAAGIFVLSRKPGKELRITCLDIGQGDGIVLEIPDGGVFLMDCGSSNKKNTAQYQLLPYLKSRGISHINGIMISHTDKDHISGIMELLEFMEQGLTSVRSDALILPDWEEPPEVYNTLIHLAHSAGMKVLQVESGNSFRMGEAGFHILAPAKDALGEDVNEEGMVVELEYRDFRGLFTGDAGEPAEKAILNRLRDVDFLKVGHHGSRYSSCREFLDQVKAEVAVISCSDSNTYGHPSPETTLRLKKSGAKTEFTMKSGAVSVCTDGKRMWVQRFLEE